MAETPPAIHLSYSTGETFDVELPDPAEREGMFLECAGDGGDSVCGVADVVAQARRDVFIHVDESGGEVSVYSRDGDRFIAEGIYKEGAVSATTDPSPSAGLMELLRKFKHRFTDGACNKLFLLAEIASLSAGMLFTAEHAQQSDDLYGNRIEAPDGDAASGSGMRLGHLLPFLLAGVLFLAQWRLCHPTPPSPPRGPGEPVRVPEPVRDPVPVPEVPPAALGAILLMLLMFLIFKMPVPVGGTAPAPAGFGVTTDPCFGGERTPSEI